MSSRWATIRRDALETAALAVLADRDATPEDRRDARDALARPDPDVQALSRDELYTLIALYRRLRGEPLGDLEIRVVGARPETYQRPCGGCRARESEHWVDVSWADADMRASIVEAIEGIRHGDTDKEPALEGNGSDRSLDSSEPSA